MPNPYIQVMLTYLRHPFSPAKALLTMGILLFFTIVLLPTGLVEKQYFLLIILFPFIVMFTYWAIHVKEQFAGTRASLMPYFRKVHGVVAMIAAIVFVILLPGVTALLIGRQPVGLVSITMFLFGIILWAVLRLGNIFFPVIAAGLVLTLFVPIRDCIEKIVSGNEPVQAFIIISIGTILSITGIIRLFLLNEEKPEYYYLRSLKFSIDGQTNLSDLQLQKLKKSYSRGLRGWFASRKAAGMIYHARHAADSYWSKIKRWNHSNQSVWHIFFNAAKINLFFILGYFVTNGNFLPGIGIFLATLIPLSFVNKEYKEKRRFMAQELMMPFRRDAYLKQLGMSFAIRLFIHWGVFMTVTVLLMQTSALRPAPEFLIISISYSLMIQIWMFGLAIWTSSFSSISMNFLGIAAVLLLLISFVIAFNPQQIIIPRWPLILGAILSCHGLLLTWRGYRRWMVADFD